MPDDIKIAGGGAKTVADRVRLHRERRKRKDMQVAVGIARLVLGQGPGEQRKALLEYLSKYAASEELPADYAKVLERAVESLTVSRFRG